MADPRILVVDDEPGVLSSLKMALSVEGYQVDVAGGVGIAKEKIKKESYDGALLDVSLPDGTGLEVLRTLIADDPETVCIMMSGQASVEVAVEATRSGALDFLEKPVSTERMLIALSNGLRLRKAEREAGELREENGQLRELRGTSPAMEKLKERVARAAKSSASVFLHGERGTGKELVARAIHEASGRAKKRLEKINCAAVPENLIESELFGHEAGAFTGATKRRLGKFELADGGTLFLDEIGDMPVQMQAKLLRVLQEQELERVGGSETIRVDVRIVCATNKDLARECEEGRFRADLFDRINVLPITLPPLRERTGDIEVLALHFLEWAKKRNDRPHMSLEKEALTLLVDHTFPGNVRELRNFMERLVILNDRDSIAASDLREHGLGGGKSSSSRKLYREGESFRELADEAERTILEQALAAHDGQMAKTARALGLERSHLYKKAKALGLRD